MIVVDASVLANAVGDEGAAGERARMLLTENVFIAPDLVDVETVSTLRKWWLAGKLSDARFRVAIDVLSNLPIARFPTEPLMLRAYELRANVTPYDACYIALAEGLDCRLLTADARLARATGIRCTVEVLTD